jgi:hypothetical protein
MNVLEALETLGLPVGFVAFMSWLFIRSEDNFKVERKSHREERENWRKEQSRLQESTNKALTDLTRAIERKKGGHDV